MGELETLATSNHPAELEHRHLVLDAVMRKKIKVADRPRVTQEYNVGLLEALKMDPLGSLDMESSGDIGSTSPHARQRLAELLSTERREALAEPVVSALLSRLGKKLTGPLAIEDIEENGPLPGAEARIGEILGGENKVEIYRLMFAEAMKGFGVYSPLLKIEEATDMTFPGWSWVQMITTSHTTAHIFEELKLPWLIKLLQKLTKKEVVDPTIAHFDVYTCMKLEVKKVLEVIDHFFGLGPWRGNFVEREAEGGIGRTVHDMGGLGSKVTNNLITLTRGTFGEEESDVEDTDELPSLGTEVTAEFFDCTKLPTSAEELKDHTLQAADRMGLDVKSGTFQRRRGAVFFEESDLTMRLWPERRSMLMKLLLCGEEAKVLDGLRYFRDEFGVGLQQVTTYGRGTKKPQEEHELVRQLRESAIDDVDDFELEEEGGNQYTQMVKLRSRRQSS